MLVFGGLALGAAVSAAGEAQAQYYPPPAYPPPGYYPPPGPGYPPPYRREVGYRCDAVRPTPYGPQPLVCTLRRPRPLDASCECVPPPPPPGYPYLPPLQGRVIP